MEGRPRADLCPCRCLLLAVAEDKLLLLEVQSTAGMCLPVVSSGTCHCWFFGHNALLYRGHVVLGVLAPW